MYTLLKNKYKLIVYQGHRRLLYSINKNTSIICSFTIKPPYFSINLSPPIFWHRRVIRSADKRNFVKFNIVTHSNNFKFQQNNKITEKISVGGAVNYLYDD